MAIFSTSQAENQSQNCDIAQQKQNGCEEMRVPTMAAGALASSSLTYDSLPASVRDIEYAVRGEIVLRSLELAKELKGPNNLPFTEIVACNIGNPQAVGQKPISFHRQMLSLLTNPELIDAKLYPEDVVARAREFTNTTNFGAYSHSKGVPILRQKIAEFIERRDGPENGPVDIDSLYLTDGASVGVKTALTMLIRDSNDGVLIPIPQYPLYSAGLTALGGTAVGYYLKEEENWAVTTEAIETAIAEFKASNPNGRLRALVIINPGNPTGNVMSRQVMEDTVRIAEKYNLVLLADEVYQENIWGEAAWQSYRKVVLEMKSTAELMSFHSISKGYYGECGIRGGFTQVMNIDERVLAEMYKLFSINLCSNTLGQAMMASIVNPPVPGDVSYPMFHAEKDAIVSSLKRKAKMVADRLNAMEGVSCQPVDGAMYAFPSVTLPPRAIAAAKAAGRNPDSFYCMEMLEKTGIVTVAGSGFGQVPGTYHYRMTILPAEEKLSGVFDRLEEFHKSFMATYGSEHNEL